MSRASTRTPAPYSFRSVWDLPATPHEAFTALRELRDYPAWWPEVKEATELDQDTYRVRARSMLPYDLLFTTSRTREEKGTVLEARLEGDLVGVTRWTLLGVGERTQCVFDEKVVVDKELLRKLDPVGRPAFRANHALMMRNGRRGLEAYLAGMRLGRRTGS